MLDFLNSIDTGLFRFLNGAMCNPVLDLLMPFITDLNKQRLVLVVLLVILLWMLIRGRREVRISAILLVMTIILSDQLNSSVIKYWFERPRPCHVLHDVRLLVSCGSGFSFPSSHAVNNFAGALVLAFFFPRGKWWFLGFASIVAYSRVYVGVHYPSDIIGGAVIGMGIAGIVLFIFTMVEKLWYSIRRSQKQQERIS